MAINHHPWDAGAISDIFKGSVLQQKTIKTECGVRVKFADADTSNPVTCPACQDAIAKREAFQDWARQELQRLTGGVR